MFLLLHYCLAIVILSEVSNALSSITSKNNKMKGFTGLRVSLYPKVKDNQSLKGAIKSVVKGISDLGLEVKPDDCSTAILGPEPTLFEAARVMFGRACRLEGKPHVSMICTFSAGCPGEPDESPLPERLVNESKEEWIEDAFHLPGRVACQYAIYPLGSNDYMKTIRDVISLAQKSPSYKPELKTNFCTTLDGDGAEVFDILRNSFELARSKNSHVTMTATLTANKSLWKENDDN